MDNQTNIDAEEQLREAAVAQAQAMAGLAPGTAVPASEDIINALKKLAESELGAQLVENAKIRVVVIMHNSEEQADADKIPAPEGMHNVAVKVMAARYNYESMKLEPVTTEQAPEKPEEFIVGARQDADEVGRQAVVALAQDIRSGVFAHADQQMDSPKANAYLRIVMELMGYPKEVLANILGNMTLGCAETLAAMNDDEFAQASGEIANS